MCGLNNETTQKQLLTESDLMFSGAIDIAHRMESATQNTQKLQVYKLHGPTFIK